MRRAAGFTLLEVLLALVILALAMTAIVLALQANTRNLAYVQDKTTAAWVASNLLADYKAGNNPAATQGEVVMLNKNWHWQLEQQDTALAKVKRIKIVVTKPEDTTPLLLWTSFID
jgi:general secretion pathway protein I